MTSQPEEPAKEPSYSELFMEIVHLAEVFGIQRIQDFPGLWEHQIDDTWTIKVNGTSAPIDGIDPYECYVFFDEMPVGLLNPFGGVLYGDDMEDELIAAVQAAIVLKQGELANEATQKTGEGDGEK